MRIGFGDCPEYLQGSFYFRCPPPLLDVVYDGPIDAFGWCVAADASAALGDATAYILYLKECRRAAPDELWLATIRFQMTASNVGLQDDMELLELDRDISVMLRSQIGRTILAETYVRSPQLQQIILQTATGSPIYSKKAFISAVRKAATS